MSKKVVVIVNPIAGSGGARRVVKRLTKSLAGNGFEAVLKLTKREGDARAEASRVGVIDDLSRLSAIICIGGDGTVNEVINGLVSSGYNSRLPLGIIPVGSGNVIAKELDLSRDTNKFIAILKQGKTRCLDVGCVNFPGEAGRYFISMAGVGFDAEIARLYHQSRKGPKLQAHLTSYLPLVLKRIMTYQVPRITLEIDDRLITREAGFIQVANVRSYGGPFVLVGPARPDDGWLDITWFRARSGRDILRYYWSAFWGEASCCPDAHHLRGKKVRLSSDQTVPLQVDGDYGGNLPAEVKIIPQVVSVLVD